MSLEALRRTQACKLRDLLAEVSSANRFYRRKLHDSGIEIAKLPSVEDLASSLPECLAKLPLTEKREIQADQTADAPYGTNLTYPMERYTRLHRTSGTTGESLVWLDTRESWRWFIDCWKRVYLGAGIGPEDRVLFPFSFGPFIGFWGAFEAAQQLGCFCLPAGGLSTSARLRHLLRNEATVVACTPTYALHLAEVAADEGLDLAGSTVRALIVAGEPGGHVPGTRARIEGLWGARVFDHHGMTEMGCISYEFAEGPKGLVINEDEYIVEILDPAGLRDGKQQPVASGETGELVLTNLGRLGSPLIRYRTRDLVRWVETDPEEARPDGSYGTGRLDGGILSRADDMFFIRGNNVYPSAVESIIREFPEVAEYRLRVLESEELSGLEVELEPHAGLEDAQGAGLEAASADEATSGKSRKEHAQERRLNDKSERKPDSVDLAERVARAIQNRLFFRARVRLVKGLPRFELKARRIIRESTGPEDEPPRPQDSHIDT